MVSFASLKSDVAYDWMVLCIVWCSVGQSLLLPLFLWACDRYRADVRSVWEKCVAIMSNDDGGEGKRAAPSGGVPPGQAVSLGYTSGQVLPALETGRRVTANGMIR